MEVTVSSVNAFVFKFEKHYLPLFWHLIWIWKCTNRDNSIDSCQSASLGQKSFNFQPFVNKLKHIFKISISLNVNKKL